MKKVLYYLLLAVLIGVFAFSAYKIGSYLVEKHKSEQVTKAAEEFTTPVETDEGADDEGAGAHFCRFRRPAPAERRRGGVALRRGHGAELPRGAGRRQ